MFKIIKAEIKKTFAKQGIYILTGILIIVLFACALLYSPSKKDDPIDVLKVNIEKRCSSDATKVTVNDIYNFFKSDNTYVSAQKLSEDIDNLENYVNFYYNLFYTESAVDDSIVTFDTLVNKYENIKQAFSDYSRDCNTNQVNVNTSRQNLYNTLKTFIDDLNKVSSTSQNSTIIISESDFKNLGNILNESATIVNPATSHVLNRDVVTQLTSLDFYNKIHSYITKMKEFKPAEEILLANREKIDLARKKIGNFPTTTEEGSGLILEIYNYAQENGSKNENSYKNNFVTLIAECKDVTEQLKSIVELSIKKDVLKSYNPNAIRSLKTFENDNYYEICEILAKNDYLFQNNSYSFMYANVLNITQSSNTYINAYDFSFFALKLCAFIIIIYCVVLAAGSIAGEQQAGTLKLLAIRPYSRGKLFLGKMLSTICIGMLLLVLSALATFIAGAISYSIISLPVLAVFNANTVVVMNVFVEFLIMLLTMFFELIFFVIIAYGISTIFKSNVGAVAISIMIYFVSLILNTLSTTYSWLRFLPFTNMNLFKYFGGAFISSGVNFLSSVLTPSIVIGATFWFSFLLSAVFAVGVLIIAMLVFKIRDIK